MQGDAQKINNGQREMNKAIKKLIPSQDIFISTAAVSDFKFEDKDTHKIDSSKALSINLKPTIKIIRQIKRIQLAAVMQT